MSYYAWYSPAATAALRALNPIERSAYDLIEKHISEFPEPIRGSDLVVRAMWFGRDLLRYSDDIFPYVIWYDFDGEAVTIVLVLAAATKRTPL